jgi:hypothetical protein
VVSGDSLAKVRIKRAEWCENFGPTHRMCSDSPPLLGRELRLVVKDIRESLVELADIMEQCDPLDAVECSLIEPGGVAENERIARYPTHVGASYGVVGIDGVKERLHRGRPEPFGFGLGRVLPIKEPSGRQADCHWHEVAHGNAEGKNRT